MSSKLLAPRGHRATIPRERLRRALDDLATNRVAIVQAPAGFGKTTALRDWVSSTDLSFGWLSIDLRDNDPAQLAAHLLAALSPHVPGGLARAEQALLAGSELADAVIPFALDAVAAHPRKRFGLVIDDFQLVESSESHGIVNALVNGAPPNLSVVIASRTPPPLRLARRRSAGELAELGAEELRLTREETGQLLNELLGFGLDAHQLDQIDARFSGWSAGLQLVAAALDAGAGDADVMAALARSRAGLDAYLIEEVLEGADPALRSFLIRTSILPRMSASLCEAVLEDRCAVALLAEAERMGPFVVPLDSEGSWLRYHELFSAALTRELERQEPELVPRLHARASSWFEREGMLDEAIEHALATGDGAHAAALLERAWPELFAARRHRTVRSLLDRLPPERGEFGPFCEALDLMCMLIEGVDERFVSEQAEALAREHLDAPGVSVLVDKIRISPYYGDARRAVEVGREAWERYADAPEIRERLVTQYAFVLAFGGDYDAARELLEPRLLLELEPAVKAWMLAALAIMDAYEGASETAERYARAAVEVIEELGGRGTWEFVGAYRILAEALRLRGQLEEARRHLDHALAMESHRPGSIGRAAALTFDAHLALAEGDRQRAHDSARRARAILARYPDPGILEKHLVRAEALLARRAGDPLEGSEPTAAERRVLSLLPSEMTLREIADALYLSRNTVKSHVHRLYRRLGVRSRDGAVAAARERGLL